MDGLNEDGVSERAELHFLAALTEELMRHLMEAGCSAGPSSSRSKMRWPSAPAAFLAPGKATAPSYITKTS